MDIQTERQFKNPDLTYYYWQHVHACMYMCTYTQKVWFKSLCTSNDHRPRYNAAPSTSFVLTNSKCRHVVKGRPVYAGEAGRSDDDPFVGRLLGGRTREQ